MKALDKIILGAGAYLLYKKYGKVRSDEQSTLLFDFLKSGEGRYADGGRRFLIAENE